jgi:hypothetical protein
MGICQGFLVVGGLRCGIVHSASLSILFGNGHGSFQQPVSYGVGGYPSSVAARPFSGAQSQDLAVGDFNADGKADLAVANLWPDAISILTGNGDGTFQTAVSYNLPGQPYALAIGAFAGAGKSDLAVADLVGVTLLTNTTR